MTLADPQSVNIGAGAVSLPRTNTGNNSSTYTSADGNLVLTVSHQYGKRTRRTGRIDIRKTAADPLFPAQNVPYTMSFYFVADVPPVGFSVTEVVNAGAGLFNAMLASTNAELTAIAQGQN